MCARQTRGQIRNLAGEGGWAAREKAALSSSLVVVLVVGVSCVGDTANLKTSRKLVKTAKFHNAQQPHKILVFQTQLMRKNGTGTSRY